MTKLAIDTTEIEKFEDDLKTFKKSAVPFANKSALNGMAFKGRQIWQGKIQQDFTLRNKFTEGSVRVEQARTLDVRKQEAVLGSIAPYMETAEFGGIERQQGKHGVVIPTATASREGDVANPRKKLPVGKNKFRNIQLKRSKRAKSKSAQNTRQMVAIAIHRAVKNNERVVFLNFGESSKSTGIYRVVGGRINKRGHVKGAKLKMLYSINRSSVNIPASHTLRDTIKEVERFGPSIYRDALIFQLRRFGLFDGK